MYCKMAVYSKKFRVKTKPDGMVDVTQQVADIIAESKLEDGVAVVFCPGSTGAVSTVEYEPGLLEDIPEALEKIAPRDKHYKHHETWGCDNGRSHVKATILGPSLTVPFADKKLVLGTWQQIVFIELDTTSRDRKLVVQVLGE